MIFFIILLSLIIVWLVYWLYKSEEEIIRLKEQNERMLASHSEKEAFLRKIEDAIKRRGE